MAPPELPPLKPLGSSRPRGVPVAGDEKAARTGDERAFGLGRRLLWLPFLLIWAYRLGVSPFLAPRCRHFPSCSEYALEALRLHGLGRGLWLSCRRIARCGPNGPGLELRPRAACRRGPGAAPEASAGEEPLMASSRLFLYLAVGLLMFMLWQQWQLDYGPAAAGKGSGSSVQDPGTPGLGEPSSTAPSAPLAPPVSNVADGGEAPAISDISGAGLPAPDEPQARPPSISVVTDVFEAEVSLKGGGLRRLQLLKYPRAASTPQDLFSLVNPASDDFLELQSGLQSSGDEAPGHRAPYRAEAFSYRLSDGAKELRVPLRWSSTDGSLRVLKTLVFRPRQLCHRDALQH